jgi:cytochrome b pre-mRNA-processing protein 3
VLVLKWLFGTRPATETGRQLYAATARQARDPWFYLQAGAPDTPEGRFEIYALHVILLLHRMKGEGPHALETSQALFDAFVRSLDDALRDMGVGDLSMGKKMRKLGEAFYGRVKSYDEALARLPDREPLRAVMRRTVYAGGGVQGAEPLSDYAVRAVQKLTAEPVEEILQGRLDWPEFDHAAL